MKKFGLFKRECGKWVAVSERRYSTFEIAAFVWTQRILESKGTLVIRRG